MTREELQHLHDECRLRGFRVEQLAALVQGVESFLAEPDPTVEIAYLKAKLADVEAGRDRAKVEALVPVLAFINERPEYVTAMKNTPGDGDLTDYHRWSGGAEARRQLATALGLTVPHNPGDRAARIESGAES